MLDVYTVLIIITEHRVKTSGRFFTHCLKKENPTSQLVQVRPAVLNLRSMYGFQGVRERGW